MAGREGQGAESWMIVQNTPEGKIIGSSCRLGKTEAHVAMRQLAQDYQNQGFKAEGNGHVGYHLTAAEGAILPENMHPDVIVGMQHFSNNPVPFTWGQLSSNQPGAIQTTTQEGYEGKQPLSSVGAVASTGGQASENQEGHSRK